MANVGMPEGHIGDTPKQAFHWLRTAAIGLSILFVIWGFETSWIIFLQPKAVDFLSFWAAAHLVALGRTASAYSIVDHRLLELMVAPIKGLLPFPYPPPFLLLVTPFGMMRYWLAFVLWIALTYGCFALSAAWIGRRYSLPFALSHPSVVTNFLIGQNGFLTASIFMLGSKLLGNAPLLAGAVFGLLIIKPQLAVLLPFAFVAGREWKAFAGAALSSISALLLAALVLGTEAYRGFFAILPVYAHGFAANLWPWNEVASPFAFFRFIGVPQVPALIGHGIIAAVAIAVTCRAWWLRHDNRIPVLAAATMLVIPYLMTYDCLFLAAPMMTLDAEQRRPHLVALIWLCCFLPVMGHFGWYHGPNTIPFASLLSLWGLLSKPASESGVANGSSALPA